MSTVLLIIQLIISLILTGLILIQRSEGGALGIGGGGGGGLMSGRSATTSIARMTGIIGALFVVNSLALSIVFGMENRDNSITDDSNAQAPLTAPVDSRDTTPPLEDVITTPESTTETPVTEPVEEEASETEEPKEGE
ncbi:protein translocase subunit secG [Litorimonas taeanensis]|uniref:Protein-export membrane protein SecG n=1 Tax=Litorimonas taeanensis TaxID=568099 RepID=A0A420WJB3_9PROT|nr:preprotein translocase subunit SecG [Litorimonas taeanensis]RKQ71100.1 protein translocase subunit secG [Litorimonas taeanensis]